MNSFTFEVGRRTSEVGTPTSDGGVEAFKRGFWEIGAEMLKDSFSIIFRKV
jgi:hypothetical protein